MEYYTINYDYNFKSNIIAFDMDNTIISTKSGKRFPKSMDDWKFIFESKTKLNKIAKKNSIIIITNQLGITKNKTKIEDIEGKLDMIRQELNIPILAMIASADNNYRKPRIGFYMMLEKMYLEKNKKIKSFTYVGDAAGRTGDHSDSDYKFLLNVSKYTPNIETKFYLPEEFLDKDTNNNKNILGYDLSYKGKDSTKKIISKIDSITDSLKNQVILISGYPASGKTTLASKLSKKLNITYFSKDKDKGKFKKLLKNQVDSDYNFIVEGLYYGDKQRNELEKLIGEKYQIINLVIDVPYDTAIHFNKFRSLTEDVNTIPPVVYNTYRKYYKDYSKATIIKVNPKLSKKKSSKINQFYL